MKQTDKKVTKKQKKSQNGNYLWKLRKNFSITKLTHMAPYYLISDVYDGKFKYYRTLRVFAVEIRKYHQKNPLEKFYEIEQCKIAINYKLGILEQCKLTIPYYIQYTRRM
jgi:hypothetical protein